MKTTRTLRYGGFASILTASFLALLIAINILAGRIPLRLDLTAEGFYTLSDQTRDVLAVLDREITLVALYEPGREDPRVDELLNKYRSASARIGVRYVDPYRSPLELRSYAVSGQPPDAGSVIVDSGARFRVLKTWELYELGVDEQTGGPVLRGFQAEQMITSAIVQVTTADDPVVYALTGHDERELPADLASRMERDNFILRPLDLTTSGEVPDDATVVIVVGPKRDLGSIEVDKLRRYLSVRGGRLVLTLDVREDPHPVLSSLLASYGIESPAALVHETDAVHFLPNQPIALIPQILDHPITATLKDGEVPVVFPVARPLVPLSERKRRVTVQPLLGTSDRAWAQVDLGETQDVRTAQDVGGPFLLAVASTDLGEQGERESRLVVLSGTEFLFPPESFGRLPQNESLFLNSLNWLRDKKELIALRARSISSIRYQIRISSLQFFAFSGVSVVLIPLAILASGLVIWLRRRHG